MDIDGGADGLQRKVNSNARCLALEARSNRVITSPAMVAAINFKWQAFGERRWQLELCAFVAFFGAIDTRCSESKE